MKKNYFNITMVMAAAAIFFVAAHHAAAEGTQVGIGIGVGAAPQYEGSEDYAATPIPYLSVNWENHMSVRWLGNKARVNLIPSPMWKGGVVGEYIAERNDVDNNRVDKLDDVDTSLMLGGFLGFEYENWSASIEAMLDVADGNDGSIVRLLGGYRIPMDGWSIGLDAFTTWADDDYMEAYFGINGSNAARSGLDTFDAESGLKDVGLGVSLNWNPWEHWGLMGIASYKRLLNDAEDSPVVDDEGDANQYFIGALVYFRF